MRKLLLLVLMATSTMGCGDDVVATYDRPQLARDMVEFVILPRHQQLAEISEQLKDAALAFSAQPDMAGYQNVVAKWGNCKVAYKMVQPYNLGEISTTYVHNKLNKWPCNTAFLDGFLADTVVLDQPFVNAQGSTSKGLVAMEYLLTDVGLTEAQAYNRLVNSSDSVRRLALLSALATDLFFNAYFLNDLWVSNGENYGQRFAELPLSGLESPINLLVNKALERLEQLAQKELGVPLGVDNGGLVDPTLAEAFRLQQSLPSIRAGIASMQELFSGESSVVVGSGLSINGHLVAFGAEATANDITTRLNAAIQQCDAMTGPMEQAIVADPAAYVALRDQLLAIHALVRTEVVSTLGITITLTDNDGD